MASNHKLGYFIGITGLLIGAALLLFSLASRAGEVQGPVQSSESPPVERQQGTGQREMTEMIDSTDSAELGELGEKGQEPALPETSVSPSAPRNTKRTQPVALQGIEPTRLSIPAIEVDTDIVPVGINDKGEMDVPPTSEQVGWFEYGAKPGESGSAVLDGHVDHKDGPAVFFDLKKLEAGDEIFVYDASGQSRSFVVDRVVAYPYDEAPLEEIFGWSSQSRLHLITCTGTYSKKTDNHDQRLVVYATLKS
ncbi:class F sortase [Marinicrinis sediminis]|uniref:Class F sortase n=1 Tax=Marinicrinis sediminis TaxID=1652465 RepID=A0ABW5R6H0_9BACL